MYTLKITITKSVLEKTKYCGVGFPKGSTLGLERRKNCAISYVIRDIFPDAETGYLEIKTMGELIDLPSDACRFAQQFDNSSPSKRILMPEFSFEIEIPDSIISKINIGDALARLENHENLELIEA
jgi:hypothetical protein